MKTDVLALLGRGTLFSAPFRNSISKACLPTIRSDPGSLLRTTTRSFFSLRATKIAPEAVGGDRTVIFVQFSNHVRVRRNFAVGTNHDL